MTEVRAGLSIHDIAFQYEKGGEELFGGLTHDFTPGRLTALTGPSGRGKSTLLYIIGLLLTPTRGEVLLDGEHVGSAGDSVRSAERASSMGFVFQDAELDPARTILDSVIEPGLYAGGRRSDLQARGRDLLTQFGLDHRADHRPGQVSGGQAQRVAVCRALLNAPRVVLADEPTGNLDRGNAALVLEALHDAGREHGCTVVIATHDPFVLDNCDEVVAL